jgi:HAD superfamily hydrolase (TIGR01549 family)
VNKIEWLFFDVGYTLINEDNAHAHRIRNTVIKNDRYTYDDIYQAMVQASIEYKQPYPTALKVLEIEDYELYPQDMEIPYENANYVLRKLHNTYKIGIIANQSIGTIKRLTEYGLMDHIDLVLSSAEEGLAKPDIKLFEKALEKGKCQAEHAVMIGDRLDNDIFPAKRIGMITVWIKQGFGGIQTPKSSEFIPDYIIKELNELLSLFT